MEPVKIGVQEIYDLCRALDTKMDTYIGMQEPRLVLLDHRVGRLETQLDKKGDRNWLLYLAAISSVIALIGAFVAPLVVR